MWNFIIGFIIGLVFTITAMILFALYNDRNIANEIKKQFGEDFKIIPIPKSKLDEVENILNKYKKEEIEKDEKTVDVRAKDGSIKHTYIDKGEL